MRFCTSSKRNCRRRVTVATRNANHSVKICFKPFWAGLPFCPIITKLIGELHSKSVFAISVLINSSGSRRDDLGSNTRRTGDSPSDSSRTLSIKDSIKDLLFCCSCVSCFLPAFGLGLVISSICAKIFCADTAGGNSDTTIRH